MSDAQRTHGEEGNTPLDEDEMEGLIPSHISTRAELNAWEAENIRLAIEWASSRAMDILDAEVLITLHRRMFEQTWRWAGKYRTSEKSISPHPWPNGNGRHACLATDLLLRRHGRAEFTWGRTTYSGDGPAARRAYLLALAAADAGTNDALRRFVRGKQVESGNRQLIQSVERVNAAHSKTRLGSPNALLELAHR